MRAVSGDLRADYAEQTRRRIARAAVDVVVADGIEHLSFPAVAERAGVSLRTVYRYFPNKDALLAGAGSAGSEATSELYHEGVRGLATLGDLVPALWRELAANHDLVQLQHTTQAGIALRGERVRAHQSEIRQRLAEELPDLTEDDRERLTALLVLLIGSSPMIDLVDHLGLDVDQAAAFATFAIDACIEKTVREGAPT